MQRVHSFSPQRAPLAKFMPLPHAIFTNNFASWQASSHNNESRLGWSTRHWTATRNRESGPGSRNSGLWTPDSMDWGGFGGDGSRNSWGPNNMATKWPLQSAWLYSILLVVVCKFPFFGLASIPVFFCGQSQYNKFFAYSWPCSWPCHWWRLIAVNVAWKRRHLSALKCGKLRTYGCNSDSPCRHKQKVRSQRVYA